MVTLPRRSGTEVVELLAQLDRGFAAWRLFPGELDRPAFAAAVERIAAAARLATGAGPVHVEVRSATFQGDEGPLLAADALARSLYAHRVERLLVLGEPTAAELGALYAAVDREPDGGTSLGSALEAAGVRTIGVGEVAPHSERAGEAVDRETSEERARAQLLADARAQASVIAELAPAGAEAVVEWLRAPERGAPPGSPERDNLRRAVTLLPDDVRRRIGARFVQEARVGDAFSRDWVRAMSDGELARALLEAALEDGEDPIDRARSYVEAGERTSALVGLTISASAGTDALVDLGSSVHLDTSFAGDEEAFGTLRQYLKLEHDASRLRTVLQLWSADVRAAAVACDAERVAALTDVLSSVDGDTVGTALEAALDAGAVRQLLPDDPGADLSHLVPVLKPLGGVAVDRTFAVLASEDDRNRRARLLALVTELAFGHVDRLGRWLRDERWYVVRNAVHVLGRVGTREAVPLIEQVTAHAEPRVRREALRALVTAAGNRAVPGLRALATDAEHDVRLGAVEALAAVASDEAAEGLAAAVRAEGPLEARARAVGELAAHPAPSARRLLGELVDDPTVPRKLRRHIRSLVGEP